MLTIDNENRIHYFFKKEQNDIRALLKSLGFTSRFKSNTGFIRIVKGVDGKMYEVIADFIPDKGYRAVDGAWFVTFWVRNSLDSDDLGSFDIGRNPDLKYAGNASDLMKGLAYYLSGDYTACFKKKGE